LNFSEFEQKYNQLLFVSATPGPYEREHEQLFAEQIIRPTGLLDPLVEVRPVQGQIDDLITEVQKEIKQGRKVLITTLTKRMAESLTDYMKEIDIRIRYLHSDIDTIERIKIIRDLRADVFDVLVGINLLREGLDIPEVALITILDADKEGFLRSETALIQTIGRAARNVNGRVIMYADTITGSMERAISETNRRREIQEAYNRANNITPQTIKKSIRDIISISKAAEEKGSYGMDKDPESMDIKDLKALIDRIATEMKKAASELQFEKAALLRDDLQKLKKQLLERADEV
jgi:excinuclease ABC subunit B